MRLRARFLLHGLASTAYFTGVVATAAFVALPALRRVDRSLAPLQSVFGAIDQRQRQLVSDIDRLNEVLDHPPGPGHATPPFSNAGVQAPASLVAIYGGLLTPGAARTLAVAEDELGAIESAFGEALARYEIGDQAGARAKVAELRRAEDQSQQHYNQAMMLALRTGVEARAAFRESMVTLGWAAVAWIVIGILLVVAITWDVNRHIWRPIHALDHGVRQIADGNWSQPVPVTTSDELGELAAQFNALTETLQRRAGQHAQLATAGELMAGVAHELNNPLQAIRGTAELKATPDAGGRDWGTVLAQAERASKLARDLVRFVRPSTRDVRLISLNEVVRTAVDLIEFQYRADGVGLELDLAQALPSVRADAHELVQVLVNLLGNAHHVLSRASGPRRVFVRSWAEQGRVYCRILDTGPGVAAEVRHRLFSPFFSTKEAGVGLGLTVSRNLIRGVGGELSLDEASPGASFTMWLPGIEKAAERAGADSGEGAMEKGMPLKGVSILIADDEDAIRGVLERFFQRDGATVFGVSGGVDALDAIRRRTVDVIVLDVRMPDKDGAEVYRELRKERPELAGRVIFLSGDVTRVTEELDVPQHRVLVKPVELGDLKRAVMDTVAGMRSTFSLR